MSYDEEPALIWKNTWEPVGTLTLLSSGQGMIQDLVAGTEPQLFYRVVTMP